MEWLTYRLTVPHETVPKVGHGRALQRARYHGITRVTRVTRVMAESKVQALVAISHATLDCKKVVALFLALKRPVDVVAQTSVVCPASCDCRVEAACAVRTSLSAPCTPENPEACKREMAVIWGALRSRFPVLSCAHLELRSGKRTLCYGCIVPYLDEGMTCPWKRPK
jgi:hypothetical protein